MLKRLFDIIFSLFGLVTLLPVLLIVSLFILLDSKGGVFYVQNRVGRFGKNFKLFKFRTMVTNADKQGLLTVGNNDSRITKIGAVLRKYKMDELPQLFNVLNGTMSFVGPRPEVLKYVELYTPEQKVILSVKPGITDYASLEYFNENELLGKSKDPEKTYIEEVIPAKIKLNKKYLEKNNLGIDCLIIFKTIFKLFN